MNQNKGLTPVCIVYVDGKREVYRDYSGYTTSFTLKRNMCEVQTGRSPSKIEQEQAAESMRAVIRKSAKNNQPDDVRHLQIGQDLGY